MGDDSLCRQHGEALAAKSRSFDAVASASSTAAVSSPSDSGVSNMLRKDPTEGHEEVITKELEAELVRV